MSTCAASMATQPRSSTCGPGSRWQSPRRLPAVTSGLARTLGVFPAFHWLSASVPGLPLLWSQVFAIAVTWFMTGLNYLGIKKAGDFQLVFTVLKGILILIVAALCFASASGSWGNFATSVPSAAGGFNGFMVGVDRNLVGLRRVERPDHGGGRGAASGAEPAHRPHRRPVHRGRAVHGDQCRDPVHSAGDADCRQRTAGGGGVVGGGRSAGSRICRGRDGAQHLRHAERHGDVGRADSVCGGS